MINLNKPEVAISYDGGRCNTFLSNSLDDIVCTSRGILIATLYSGGEAIMYSIAALALPTERVGAALILLLYHLAAKK